MANQRLSLVVEVVDVLHVAEDDVFLVGDACRNLLHAVGHLPQVVLTGGRTGTRKQGEQENTVAVKTKFGHAERLVFTSRHSWRSLT